MHLHLLPLVPLFLACVTNALPVQPRGPNDHSTTTPSLENKPGPHALAPAPIWQRDANPKQQPETNSLENTPGPYKFKPAPVSRRGAAPGDSQPGPYHLAPAPVPSSGSLESTPGPYKFKPAPVWPAKPKPEVHHR
ncbi:MAG: hypothetical protein Q9218_001719 [Villophora microphyllina]